MSSEADPEAVSRRAMPSVGAPPRGEHREIFDHLAGAHSFITAHARAPHRARDHSRIEHQSLALTWVS